MQVTGKGGVPATGVASVVLNVTVVTPQTAGYITVWPSGIAKTNTSNLNFQAGQNIPNTVIVPVGTDGKIQLFNGSAGTTHLLVDVTGYTIAGPPPVVSGLSTSSGEVTGGETLSITGSGLYGTTSGHFDDQPATSFQVVSGNTITTAVPPSAPHTVPMSRRAPRPGHCTQCGEQLHLPRADRHDNSTLVSQSGTFIQDPNTVLSVSRTDDFVNPDNTRWVINTSASAVTPNVGQPYLLRPGSETYPAGTFGTVTSVMSVSGRSSHQTQGGPTGPGNQHHHHQFHRHCQRLDRRRRHTCEPDRSTFRRRAWRGCRAQLNRNDNLSIDLCDGTDLRPGRRDFGSASLGTSGRGQSLRNANAGNLITDPYVNMYVTYQAVLSYSITADLARKTCRLPPKWQNTFKKVFLIGDTPFTISFAPDVQIKLSAGGTITVTDRSYHMNGFHSNPDGTISKWEGNTRDPLAAQLSGHLDLDVYGRCRYPAGVLDRLGVGISSGYPPDAVRFDRPGAPPQSAGQPPSGWRNPVRVPGRLPGETLAAAGPSSWTSN